jgi:hypothetical protein
MKQKDFYEFVIDGPHCYEFPKRADRDAIKRVWIQEFATRLEGELKNILISGSTSFPFSAPHLKGSDR